MAENSAQAVETVEQETLAEDSKTSLGDPDFEIKVGDDSYPVHQNVLILSSEYFRGMLAHDTKERQDGFVEIKEIDSQTMKLCIDFMYDCDIEVTMETTKTLFPAAEFLQLTELSKQCADMLGNNLKSGNCITVLRLARAYNCYELAETALNIFKEEFKMENYEDFCQLDKEGIKQHINDLDMEIAWDGIVNWIKFDVENRSSDIGDILQDLNWEPFPSTALLYAAWTEPNFKSSEFCRNLIFKRLFLDAKLLKMEINGENCFIVDKISSEFVFLTKEASDVISEFLSVNLMQIASQKEFLSLSKDKILHLFSNSEIGLCAETARWNAALKWMKNNPEEIEIFSELLKCIRFDQLSKSFIKSAIETEPFVAEITSFQDVVLRSLLNLSKVETYVAILYPDGRIYAWNIFDKIWRRLPDCPVNRGNAKMFSFRGKLCVLVDEELFYLGKNETKWIPRASMKHRPNQFYTVVTSSDNIYVAEKERMSCYDPDTNIWDESLPGCDLDGKLIAGCTSERLFVKSVDASGCSFQLNERCWSGKRKGSQITINSSMASKDDRMYAVGSHSSSKLYQRSKCYKNKAWSDIKETPVSINKSSHLFFVDERLILLVGGNFYSYDEACNSWMNLDVLPPYSRGLGNVKCQEPVSVCSFSGNLDKIPTIDISK